MKKTIILLGLLLATSSSLLAQQESMITFYKDHLNLVNPAFVGTENGTIFQSTIRQQWTGIKDAPSTQAVSFMTPVGKKLALGLSFVHDKVFIEKQSFVTLDLSYNVTLTDELDLFMGIKAGGNNYEVNTNGLETYNIISDPSLVPISRFNPNVGVGFYLKHDKFYVSLSTPKMLNTERAKNEDGYATVSTDRVHYYFSGGYNFDISGNVELVPSVMVRYVNGAPFSTDFTATTIINEGFHLGATYRTDKSLAGLAKIKISKNFMLGYAYEYSLRKELLGRANGSNEFYLKFSF
ncbi:type IX secretion system membrane protein PorP/SprF [Flavobacterium sp. HXWNR69]|uniref:Type IX secretion system membrane protein PorP/SprF n=1 Tax=Flavobacterium fragile TaxID=2949085 RepID=A0ABT0TJB4_9FLAO|nr:type IX secretion system membrane protein PorP/SprF [Flavobacterium sp. HXWNR69]MCL9770490.1 type IX secretion system membrane protein PorP/SprF [Flavobacterium sp. HXWNR69]